MYFGPYFSMNAIATALNQIQITVLTKSHSITVKTEIKK